MIVPSIDLEGGQTVQLVGGEGAPAVEAGDPVPLAERFGQVGPVAVIDLDAARGRGDNAALIEQVLGRARCRVGGGIRTVEAARTWLDKGAEAVILGTAAQPELLAQLPRARVIAALDARDGEVVDQGWTRGTGATIEERIDALRDVAGGFLITFVEREGRLGGTEDLERIQALVERAQGVPITVAGGVTTAAEVAALDRIGVDAQVGMSLYTGRLTLADALTACLVSDRPDGLWPTVVCDEAGRSLGLCWSNATSVSAALDEGRGIYWSRKRGLWRKGESSGATQALLAIDLDCDRDALRFTVRQEGSGFCHRGTRTCFGPARGLDALSATLATRVAQAPAGSYTRRLLDDRDLLRAKLVEEAEELARAKTPEEVRHETADVLFFALTAMTRAGVTLAEVETELDRRAKKLTRRPGNAKPNPTTQEVS